MTTALRETTTTAPVKRGNRWLVTVATPRTGTSGKYSPEMLAEYGPVAFPPKTKAYFGHALPENRDPRDQLGSYPNGVFWNAETQELQAELQPYKRWEPVIQEMYDAGDELELSLFALDWEKDASGNITRIGPHRGNTIDAVAFGALEGSGVKSPIIESLVEAARDAYGKEPGSAKGAQGNGKDNKMEEKLDKLIAIFESFVSKQESAKEAEVQAKVDRDAIAAAESAAVEGYSARIALVEAARESLLPSQVESLMEAAKVGTDIAPLVESAKKVYEEATKVLSESVSGGRSFGTGADEDWVVAGVQL